eukprot:scaffold1124_cov361-Prasinococcus_capsulatus_cf.AAC.25
MFRVARRWYPGHEQVQLKDIDGEYRLLSKPRRVITIELQGRKPSDLGPGDLEADEVTPVSPCT